MSGTIPNQSNGFGTVSVLTAGIQNGSPDAIALVNGSGVLVQFLSYEGTFTGLGGVANGVMSVDVGVSESALDPAGGSIRLIGSGNTYAAFTWTVVTSGATAGTINAGQTFAAPLPVTYLNFSATPTVFSNLLTWQTANEVNNSCFQVERLMTNGQLIMDNQWTSLGFVAAKSKVSTFDFVDNIPLSISYYRLRQIDNDGKETLSKVVTVSRDKGGNKLHVFPNPVSNVLTIEADNTSVFNIINLLGQVVLTGKTPPSGAGGLDVSALPAGTYFLKVGEEQAKFIKQ